MDKRRRESGRSLLLIGIVFASVTQAAAEQQEPGPGLKLFGEHCAVCHGAFGEGASGPDLTNASWQAGITDSDLGRIIGEGIGGTAMPGFANRLNPDAVRSLVQHVRQFASDAVQPVSKGKARKVQ